MWPAFWMLGDAIEKVGWPACGEIDIMENIGKEPAIIHGSIHGPGYTGDTGVEAPYKLPAQRFADDFYIFAIEWDADSVSFYVEQNLFVRRTRANLQPGWKWVFDKPFFLILNLAVGGDWPGNPDSPAAFPQSMLLDYVRAYQRSARVSLRSPRSESSSFSLRDSLPTFSRVGLPFCNVTSCLTLSNNPDADGGGFRRADSSGERSGTQCSEHGSRIFVDDGQQSASRRFWGPPSSLPVLDSVKAEPKRVRECGLCHAKLISDRFHVHFLGHMCLESFLLSSKKCLNVIQAIHHLLELRFHAISRRPRKYYRPVSLARCALPSTGFLSEKPQ
jgi:hypothetical protein